jgi:hypothetical protein
MASAADSGRDVDASIDAGRGELLKVLLHHEVKFVVIGGAAIQSHGRRYVTEDIDLTPDTDSSNLQRLCDAFKRARLPAGDRSNRSGQLGGAAPRLLTPRALLAASVWNLTTRYGLLDLTFSPSGFPGGYADLAPHATTMPAAGTSIAVLVASLEDVQTSKRAADPPKARAYFEASEGPA